MSNIPSNYFKEKLHLTYLLTAVFLLIIFDVSLDFLDGLSFQEMAFELMLEGSILVLVLITTGYIWNRFTSEKISKASLAKDLEKTRQLASAWKKRSLQFVEEFQEHIGVQFDRWSLSKSERAVALLLLQGKSSKEISLIRFTSERTIRNQCRAIYEKSGLGGKSEFSAFFLSELISDLQIP